VYVGIDDSLAGIIAYYDPARPQAQPLVTWLHTHGVHELYMVTGDDVAAAEPIADALGVDHVRAGVMPDEKAAIVAELQRRGHTVAVVGDGINDSPALALADVSISLKSGADVARETADVVLMQPRKLMRIAEAIQLSRDCVGLIRQNLAIVAAPNAAALGLATTVGLSPVASTLLNNGSSIVAAVNSLRPLMADGALRPRAMLGR
jgi:Cu2+-exporting ATPase